MKLDIRMEDGAPIIFFVDDMSEDKSIPCYNKKESHNYVSRGYMRRLCKPETESEVKKSWELLAEYARLV
jgi:hypothetical protein